MALKDFLDSLTLGELEFYEDTTGEGLGELYDNGKMGKSSMTLYYILLKRDQPDLKIEDLKNVNALEAVEAVEAYTKKATPPQL